MIEHYYVGRNPPGEARKGEQHRYYCRHCGDRFATIRTLLRHLQKFHPDEVAEDHEILFY